MYNHRPIGYACPFCSFVAGEDSEYNTRADIVYQDSWVLAYVSPKWWANNPGNVIIIPKKHIEHLYDMDDETLARVHIASKLIAIAMKHAYGCDGTLLRQHNEPAGSQEIFHYHLHLFPRWTGDAFYQNLERHRYVDALERQPFADKLRDALET